MRFVAIVLSWFCCVLAVRGDAFDHYTNDILQGVPASKNAEKIARLTPELMVRNSRTLPATSGTFLVVRTNEGRFARLLVHPAAQKVDDNTSAPILLIERFVTYREGEERTVHAKGENVRVFGGFRFNLDIGQVTPEPLPADLKVTAQGDDFQVEPVGKAEIYLVKKHLDAATPKKLARVEIGAEFESRFFNGTYKLFDDGRRSGTLHLEVKDNDEVAGFYHTDKDGSKYPVLGKVGRPAHNIEFQIMFPRSLQSFRGWMFTGDGKVITGSSRMQERESGFYATRIE